MARVEPNISREALFEKLQYTPHPGRQMDIHTSTSRFRIACCGRRYGKSTWAGREMTLKMFVPQSINWIVSPEYTLGEKEFRVVWFDFKKLGLLGRCKTSYNVRQGNLSIYFPELESLLEVKSEMRPDSLVGEGVDHVCMSETAKINRKTWQMYIRPALADKKGSGDFPSTPQGFNWYQGMFELGQDPTYTDYSSWQLPSWENTHVFPGGIDDPEILEMRKNLPEATFNQEIGAQFTSFEGQIYSEFSEDIHVFEFPYNPDWESWWSFDFGFKDPFVCLDIMVDMMQRVWVWREYQVSFMSTGEHGIVITRQREDPEGFHVDQASADPRGADEIATLEWIIRPEIHHNALGWSLGINEIKEHLKVREDGLPGLIIHPRCKDLIRQMKNLRAKGSKDGHNEKPGQHDYDDHGPDCLRYFFNERFVLGSGSSLADVYNAPYKGSEAESFFKYEGSISLNKVAW
jgi:hypothetical protein